MAWRLVQRCAHAVGVRPKHALAGVAPTEPCSAGISAPGLSSLSTASAIIGIDFRLGATMSPLKSGFSGGPAPNS